MVWKSNRKFRLEVSEEEERILNDMMARAGITDRYDMFVNAAMLMLWAIRQLEHGRVIKSVNPNEDEDSLELGMEIFSNIKNRYPADSMSSLIDDETGRWILSELLSKKR